MRGEEFICCIGFSTDMSEGYLSATNAGDFALILDLCERASSSSANAKQAAKALHREFKCVYFSDSVLPLPF